MIECKVLVPFVNADSSIALNVNDIIELKVERAKELEVKGLVEITANPLILNNSSTPQAPESGNTGNFQADNDDEDPENDDAQSENDDESNNPAENDDETSQTSDDEDIGEHKSNKKSNKNKK